MSLLDWSAQVAGHAAYVQARRVVQLDGQSVRAAEVEARRRRLLAVLADGRPHLIGDLQRAVPGLPASTLQRDLVLMMDSGQIRTSAHRTTGRTYQLTTGAAHEH